ncbi:unnamed protein product [Caenorhabditis brenneri]
MLSSKVIVLLLSIATFTSGVAMRAPSSSKSTVEDAFAQSNNLIRCWERDDESNPLSTHSLSEPVYELCSYKVSSLGYEKFYVSGLDMSSDDYTHVLALHKGTFQHYAVLNVCIQEAFPWKQHDGSSYTNLRCFCKRNGCNAPRSFISFLDFNKMPMPEVL